MSHRKIPITDEEHDRRERRRAPEVEGGRGTVRGGEPGSDAGEPTQAEGARATPGNGAARAAGAGPEGPGAAGPGDRAGLPDAAASEAPPREAPAEAALREQLMRLAAEFDNFRKREARERMEAWSRAKGDLAEKLLPALDDLARVAHPEAAEAPPDSAIASLLAGVELVERKLLQTLEREGLERIEAEDAAFDPALHEAILTRPTDRPELDGRVAHVALPGYRFGDRLLRPAKVVVWKLQR
jgi:molecular chaperone GrpE